VVKHILNIIYLFIYWITWIFPKDKNLFVFGSAKGIHFSDNSKYLFLYLINKKDNIRKQCYWITKNKELVIWLKKNKLPCLYYYSFFGLYKFLRAKTIIISYNLNNVIKILIGGKKVINLWHGVPLKKIGYDADDIKKKSINIRYWLKWLWAHVAPFQYYAFCHEIICTSKNMLPYYHSAFRISKPKIIISGQPRNDILSSKYIFKSELFPEIQFLKQIKTKNQIIVSWLPTYRKETPIETIYFNSKTFLNVLFDFFAENDMKLIIKPHHAERGLIKKAIYGKRNVIMYKFVDPYPLLRYTDVLITDYSSIFFDYLLLNRQIIFNPFDYDEYSKTVGFNIDYMQNTPGPKCMNWEEVTNELKNRQNDSFNEFRQKIKKYVFKYDDFNSCKRIQKLYFS